jgi:hypothetical protein
MRNELEVQAEVLKLARLLGRDPETLPYLGRVPLEDLRALRERITEVLFTAHEGALRRLAAASKLLPVGLVASLGQNTFGPMLSARITGLLEPDRAVEVAARLPTDFLADAAIELDPRRASKVVAGIPPAQISEITAELARRGEYVTMGRFVGHLDDAALASALKVLGDDELLQTLVVMEERPDLERLARLTDRERVDRLASLPDSPIPRP